MDQVTQQKAALVEEAAAESMAGQAHHLQAAVAAFKVTRENTSLPARAVIRTNAFDSSETA